MYHGHGKLETLQPIISSVGYLYENSMMPSCIDICNTYC